jgi:hypothetical protein
MRTRLAAGVAALLTGAALTVAPSATAVDVQPDATVEAVKPPPVRCYFNWLGLVCIRLR